MSTVGALLLIGAPGVGKSLLGSYLQRQQPLSTRFLSVGDELRDNGLLQQLLERPSTAMGEDRRRRVRELLRHECRAWASISLEWPMLVLECVEELEDAFMTIQVLREERVPLLQVLYIPSSLAEIPALQTKPGWQRGTAAQRDKDRLVLQRQGLWAAHASRIIEFFSALGCLSEVTDQPQPPRSSAIPWTAPSLAALGYAAGPPYQAKPDPVLPRAQTGGGKNRRRKKGRRGAQGAPLAAAQAQGQAQAGSSGAAAAAKPIPPEWLRATGWELPFDLKVTALETVTSRRLVTCAAERDWVLQEAARCSGLKLFGSPATDALASGERSGEVPRLPMPSALVASAAEALWVGRPGRYAVSRKADGTRYLLLALGQPPQPAGAPPLLHVAAQASRGPETNGSAAGFDSCDVAAAAGTSCFSSLSSSSSSSVYLLNRAGTLYAFPATTASLSASPTGSGATDGTAGCISTGNSANQSGSSAAPALPPGTVLDGTLVWMGGRGFFLTFDALCIGGRRVWQLPLRGRLTAMEQRLGLAEAEVAHELMQTAEGLRLAAEAAKKAAAAAAAAAATSAVAAEKKTQPAPFRAYSAPMTCSPAAALAPAPALLSKKQQAPVPGRDTLLVLRKGHLPVSSCALRRLEATRESCPYPTDGLVFTPYDMPYVLGMAELLYKWQPGPSMRIDVPGWEKNSRLSATIHKAVVPELVYEAPTDRHSAALASVRWDKLAGNSPHAVEALCTGHLWAVRSVRDFDAAIRPLEEARSGGGSGDGNAAAAAVGCPALASAPAGGLGADDNGSGGGNYAAAASAPWQLQHLARLVPYDALYDRIMAAVAAGCVERHADVETGLEVFCYKPDPAPRDSLTSLCNNLVLHPPSRSIVATPFPRLEEAPAGTDTRTVTKPSSVGFGRLTWSYTVPYVTATLLPDEGDDPAAQGGCCGQPPEPLSCASAKVDGTLVVAFVWGGGLRTLARGRMDSKQALWSATWLRNHANPAAFRPGWTYLLEAVYDTDTHIVPYPFEGLVLLAAVDPDGRELAPARLPALALELGVTMAVPYITGTARELTSQLPGCHTPRTEPDPEHRQTISTASNPPAPAAAPSYEGWVLLPADSVRRRLVPPNFKRVALAGQMLHPLCVWDRVRCGGASRESLGLGLPVHFRAELAAVLTALEEGYHGARGQVLRLLQRAQAGGLLSRLRQLGGRVYGFPIGGSGTAPGQAPGAAGAAAGTSQAGPGTGPAGQAAGPAPAPTPAAVQEAPSVETVPSALGMDPVSELTILVASLNVEEQRLAKQQGAGAAGPSRSSGPAASGGRNPGALVSAAITRALAYAATTSNSRDLPAASALAPSMYCEWTQLNRARGINPKPPMPGPALRGLLLDCVRPAPDGSLPGYELSATFAETYARGWPAGPALGRMAWWQSPSLINTVLPDSLLEGCLAPLEDRDVVAALLVCTRWRDVMRAAGPPGKLRERLEEGRKLKLADRDSYTSSDFDGGCMYGYGYEDEDDDWYDDYSPYDSNDDYLP